MELLDRFGVPADLTSLRGLERLVSEHTPETRHLDFKRQLSNSEDLADDLVAMVNSGGGVLVIGVGTDRHDRASSLHPLVLRTAEQQAVQAAREGVDESIRIDPIPIPTENDPGTGYLVILIPPSSRLPHLSSKRGRVLHRVGTHNKPMTRREIGVAFCAGGANFAREFGLIAASEPASLVASASQQYASTQGRIHLTNRGGSTAFNITISALACPLLYEAPPGPDDPPWGPIETETPPYLPIISLPPGAEVSFAVTRTWGATSQDVLTFTWDDELGGTHQASQAVTW
ncbi:ATP-binding protein [Nonomuraea sp. NPDC050786]|uniref:AlbA family DNA-binding domain-containing protein n=1 Tax=Nonomuraea sp. NPDC050786 TaxID=3154840 RepID=UPI0033E5C4D8